MELVPMSDSSTQERIAIVDLADDLQVRKQRIFKVVRRLGIRPAQRRESSRGNQNVATVTPNEASAIRAEIVKSSDTPGAESGLGLGGPAIYYSDDVGFFYVIQLEPQHDSGRFKVGFTTDLEGRLRKHRCAAPFAQYVSSFPAKRGWERAAIDCVTNRCEQLHTEVFRAESLEHVANRAQSFFSLMPSLEVESEDDR
jgi:T5orf172 domain